ncbi:GGDEF domain-containing protein [Lysobacter xanthus]
MDLIRQLDTATLAFVTGLAGFLLAGTMMGIRMAGMRNPALVYWGLAGLAFGLGHQLGHLFLTVSLGVPKSIALTIANGLITSTHVLLLAGVRAYLGRPTRIVPLLALAAALIVVGLVWTEMQENLRLRVLVLSGFYLALDFTSGLTLWRARADDRRFQGLAAGVFVFNGTFLAVRFVYAATTHGLTSSFVNDPFQVLFFVVSLVFVYVLTLALALLMFRGKEVELQRLVHCDPLTGLFNRRSLFEHAAREQARCERYGTPLSLVMLDIDRFKSVNDTFGHGAGDDVICEAAARIACELRDVDAAFRLGGEEFLILLPSTALDHAVAVAERLRQALSARPIGAIGRPVTASFGVTELARGQEDWEAALRRADAALYRAKDEGRDRVFAMSPPPATARPVAEARAAGAVLDLP